jgi:glycine hydroxymethyltransferase
VSYGLNAQEDIDYDAMEKLARETKPKLIIAGASAFALRIDFERFGKIAKEVGAYFGRYGALCGPDRCGCISESGAVC